VGQLVTLTGNHFGTSQGDSAVTFNGTTAQASNWSDGTIAATVPAGASTGQVVVTVQGVSSNGMAFSVVIDPQITQVVPAAPVVGEDVVITGSNFGSIIGDVSIAGVASTIVEWTNTSVTVTVPPAVSGSLSLTSAEGRSNSVPLSIATTISTVKVTGFRQPGTSTYTYELVNSSDRSVVQFAVGASLTTGECQLSKAPAGYDAAQGPPMSSVSSPSGWFVDAFGDEASGMFCVVFQADETSSAWDVQPGAGLAGFSVTLSGPEDAFLSAPVTVTFDDGSTLESWVDAVDPPQ
jgi:hypothetical protein